MPIARERALNFLRRRGGVKLAPRTFFFMFTPLQIIIDTREQTPWHWEPQDAHCVRGTLKTGDYALVGDDGFAVERKSLNDFLGTVSSGWERFERELKRAREAGFVMPVIVEGDIDEMLWSNPSGRLLEPQNNHPRVNAGFVLRKIAQIIVRNGHCFIPCKTVENAAAVAYACLTERNNILNELEIKDKNNGTVGCQGNHRTSDHCQLPEE